MPVRILFHTAGSRNGLERVAGHGPGHKKEVDPKNRHFFIMEKHIEDVKQDEKHVPDLLEAIMRATDPIKEELRRSLMKMSQFVSKIQKSRFQLLGFRRSDIFPPEASASLLTNGFK